MPSCQYKGAVKERQTWSQKSTDIIVF